VGLHHCLTKKTSAAGKGKVLDGFKLGGQPKKWVDGKFLHPHDACFDAEGNIFVAESVDTGRVSKLRKLA
jgi:hypothetical protein